MEKQTICTAYEAVAAWDLSRGDSTDFNGMLLVLDLDCGSAGLCRCTPGQPPVQIWEYTGSLSGSFFRDAVWVLMPGCASPDGEKLLRESLTGLFGSRIQKNYIRSYRDQDLDLPEVLVDGQVYQMTCAGLTEVFDRSHRHALEQMLAEAKAELGRQGAEATCRLVPVGELAGLFTAEYMVRETFLERPLLLDDRLRMHAKRENSARIVEQGYKTYRQQYSREKTIGKYLRLQVLRRKGAGVASELLTLAKSDSTYSQLRQNVAYVGPVCIVDGEPLTLYADSSLHRISLPAGVLSSAGQLDCVEVGVEAVDEELYLSVRNQSGKAARVALNNIVASNS